MCHRDDDIALFVSCVDIAVSVGNPFQRIASIDDRLYLSHLNKLCEEIEAFSVFALTGHAPQTLADYVCQHPDSVTSLVIVEFM